MRIIALLVIFASLSFGEAYVNNITGTKWRTLSPGNGVAFTENSTYTLISASVEGVGDNLGDHVATKNISLGTNSITYEDGSKLASGVKYCFGMSVASVTYGTSPSSVTGCVFALTAANTYYFEFFGMAQTTATADGYGVYFTGPALNYVLYTREIQIVAGKSTDSFSSRILTAWTVDAAAASVNPANGYHAFRISGICCPSASGNLQLLRFGETATSKLTFGPNCWGRLTRITP